MCGFCKVQRFHCTQVLFRFSCLYFVLWTLYLTWDAWSNSNRTKTCVVFYVLTLNGHKPPFPLKDGGFLFFTSVTSSWTPSNGEEILEAVPCKFISCICKYRKELLPASLHHLPELTTRVHTGNKLLNHAGNPVDHRLYSQFIPHSKTVKQNRKRLVLSISTLP